MSNGEVAKSVPERGGPSPEGKQALNPVILPIELADQHGRVHVSSEPDCEVRAQHLRLSVELDVFTVFGT